MKKPMMLAAAFAATFCTLAATINVAVKFDAKSGSDATLRTGTATWNNTGSKETDSPYVRVTAGDGVLIRFSDADAWGKSIEFLATSKTAPASKLKVNETGSLQFLCMTDSDDRTLELSWTQGNGEAFPWSDIGPSLKPSYVDDAAWTFALATLKSRFGTTWNSYLSRLRDDADSLAGCGRPVNRLDRLLQVEINAALGVDAVLPVLASVTDAARSARGLGLSFTRSYSSAMYGRFNKGIFGYGWTDNLSTYAELSDDKNTLVFRTPGGGSYAFTKATGSWQPEDARDKSVLAESSSAYTLTYQSGTVQTFAKSNMRTASIADNSGNKLTFTWSGTTLQNIAHTDGQSLTFGYSGGLLASVTDDYGRETRYTYSDSLLTKVTAPDGLETLYEYRAADGTAAARALSRITYFDGTTREYSYDTSSGLVSAVSVNGGKEKTTISRNGLNVTLTGPDGAATTLSLGVSGEVLKTTDALGGVATNGYTEDGLLKSVVSPSGLTGSISHDALGRVGKSVSANGAETAFAYEETFGNLKTVTDANGHAVTYGYDEQGRGKSVTFADGSYSTLEYNDRGDVLKSTNRRGQSISYEYDSQGRIKKKTWSNGRTFTYEYDAHDNVTQAADSETGTVTMQYDPADRLNRIEYPKGRGFTFSYDSAGRLATRTSLDGVAEKFAYDASGRLASVSDGNGNVYIKNTYDETTGRLAKQENGNGTSVSYLYDKLGRVVSIEHRGADGKIAEALQYCYDADGRCIRAASLFGEERYTYDKDGQLTAVDYPDIADETFAYDAVGNRKTANGATYSVNNLNQYTAVSGEQNPVSAITYDRDGNMTSLTDANGTTTYTYDTLNRLVAVENATAGIDWSCTYDVFGNRVSVTDNGVTTERTYLQGSLPSVAAEYVNGELKERHIVVGAVKLATLSTPNSQLSTSYYHADLIGSTRLVTDGSGAIVDRRAYKAFGETRVETDTTATAGYVGTLGVETDSTGLLFMRNRYYSPALGRFIQMDPIGLNGEDVNLYRYCGNETYNSIDPIGCVPDEIIDKSRSGVVGTGIGVTGEIANHPGWLIQHLYGDGIHKVREIGGGGLSLSGRANANATIITKSASVLKTSASVAGAGMSAYDSWNKIQAGDPTGFLISYGKGVASFVPFVNKLVLAWDVGMLLGEGAAWIHYNVINNISANKVLSALHVPSLQTAISIIVSSGEDPGTDDDPDDDDDPGDGSGGSDTGDDDPGTGDDPGTDDDPDLDPDSPGDGTIMNLTDWMNAVISKSGTYSLGADIVIELDRRDSDGGDDVVVYILETGKVVGYTDEGYDYHYYEDGHHLKGRTTIHAPIDFSGTLNGNGHKITVKGKSPAGDWMFLFGGAKGATFENVVFEGAGIRDAENCIFKNCSSISFPMVREATGCKFENCGGVANINKPGYHKPDGENFKIGAIASQAERCEFYDCNVSGMVGGDNLTGGIVGLAIDSNFFSCRSSAAVIGDKQVGGLVGYATSCGFNDCKATGTVSGRSLVGGFAGYSCEYLSYGAGSKFTNCTASGDVSGMDGGGFAGALLEGTSVSHCSASGKVVASSSDPSDPIGSLGGFVGEINDECEVSDCIATGAVVANAATGVGGFVGSCTGNTDNPNGTVIQRCCARGTVTGGTNVGGFAGGLLYSSILDCCATGAATAKGATVSAGGYSSTSAAVGGFAAVANPLTGGVTLRHCYAGGKVSAPSAASYNDMVTSGGLTPIAIPSLPGVTIPAEQLSAMIQSSMEPSDSCYWNKTTTGQNYSGTGTGLTATQARSQSSYSGWDFNNVWIMGNSGPELRNVGATTTAQAKAKVVGGESATATLSKTAVKNISYNIASPAQSRVYSYDRYVTVKGTAYAFKLSAEANAAVSVSGLPSGFKYSNGEIVGAPSAAGTATMTITSGTTVKKVPFAVIEAPGHFSQFAIRIVEFDANGGNCNVAAKTVQAGCEIGTLPSPTREGHAFAGWFTSADGGIQVTASTKVSANSTYYAHWTKIESGDEPGDETRFKVTFNPNDGSRSFVRFVRSGTAVGSLSTPTRSGYVFEGWFTSAKGGTKISPETKVTGDVTYYAHWTAKEYEPDPPGGGGSGGNVPVVPTAITKPWTATKAVTLNGAMYDKEGNIAGVVQLKVAKPNVRKGTVRVSGAIMPLGDKKTTLKPATVPLPASAPVKAAVATKTLGTLALTIGDDGFEGTVGMYTVVSAEVGGSWTITDAKVYVDFGSGGVLPDGTQTGLLPHGEPVILSGGKWTFAKAAQVKWAKNAATGLKGIAVNTDRGKTNLSGMKLTYAPKTGIFKGSFKIYAIQNNKLKKYTVKTTGVVVDGEGYGLATLKNYGDWNVSVGKDGQAAGEVDSPVVVGPYDIDSVETLPGDEPVVSTDGTVSTADFKTWITGVAVVKDLDAYYSTDLASLPYVSPQSAITVPLGHVAVFRIVYDYPKDRSGYVWVNDGWPEGLPENWTFPLSYSGSGLYSGRGIAYGFISFSKYYTSFTLRRVNVATRAEPRPEGFPFFETGGVVYPDDWRSSVTPVNIRFGY